MRFCNQCHHMTIGEPLFCNFCGASYDERICPARHINPRNAEICSQCGSRDLSTPAPRLAFWLIALLWLARAFPGVLLSLLSLLLLVGTLERVLSGRITPQLVIAGLAISILWFSYMYLPRFLRDPFRSLWRHSKRVRRIR
jgi:RNA polymerase subunit RPABC4/transcription elongation factor Spt4